MSQKRDHMKYFFIDIVQAFSITANIMKKKLCPAVKNILHIKSIVQINKIDLT